MKKISLSIKWLACVATACMAFSAQAQECLVRLDQTEVDYGVASHERDSQRNLKNGMVGLGRKPLSLNISCPNPQAMQLTLEAAAGGSNEFRFANKGRYAVAIGAATLDGREVHLAYARGGRPVLDTVSKWKRFGMDANIVPVRDGKVEMGKNFSAKLWVEARIPREELIVKQQEYFNGYGRIVVDALNPL
ncbi:hypothetical protein [Chromobacterium amazonense]|uniref:Spore coat protein U domain-containing protein n=1 Tax=Chromobacterium amazonense TaxID=1382803 RepID=A0ABU8UZ27_9NEIS|nr:hypothetical protein [Chromobacterium amazonense]MDQ4540970.1 hypothetical protein [Chromobacterium amazonense]